MTHSGFSVEVGFKPLSDTLQVQVDAHQSELPAPFDSLIWLYDQPLRGSKWNTGPPNIKQSPWICIDSGVTNIIDTRLKYAHISSLRII